MALTNKPFANPIDTTTLRGIEAASKLPPVETAQTFGLGRELLGSFGRDGAYVPTPNAAPAAPAATATPTATPTAKDATSGSSVVGNPYTLESDPVYQAAISAGQSQFNSARAEAMANKNADEMQLGRQRRDLDTNAAEARRRTAGNYAARGMAGGATGALTLAEMEANARQITAQTDIKDQISALNANYLANYGNAAQVGADGKPNFDWTSTLIGQNYKTQAAQNALNAQLARMGIQ